MLCLSTIALMPCTPFVRLDMKTVSMASLYSCRQGRAGLERGCIVRQTTCSIAGEAETGMPGAHSDTAGQAAKSAMPSDLQCRVLGTQGKLQLHVRHFWSSTAEQLHTHREKVLLELGSVDGWKAPQQTLCFPD